MMVQYWVPIVAVSLTGSYVIYLGEREKGEPNACFCEKPSLEKQNTNPIFGVFVLLEQQGGSEFTLHENRKKLPITLFDLSNLKVSDILIFIGTSKISK